MKLSLESLQPLGRALMLPIAVLPIAGLLLRLGQPDLLNLPFVEAAGAAVFDNLGLLFAAGIGAGIARDGNGAAALAGLVCFLVATRGAATLLPVPPEIRLEVEIAAGERIGSNSLSGIADPAALTCPACGGVLSALKIGHPLRFRCQVGHAYTADALTSVQEGRVDEALRVALRIIEERAELVQRMAQDGKHRGRAAVAKMYESRAAEYRENADLIRRVMLQSLDRSPKSAVGTRHDPGQ